MYDIYILRGDMTEPTRRGGYKAVSVGRGQGTEPTSRGGYKAGFSGEGAGD